MTCIYTIRLEANLRACYNICSRLATLMSLQFMLLKGMRMNRDKQQLC